MLVVLPLALLTGGVATGKASTERIPFPPNQPITIDSAQDVD